MSKLTALILPLITQTFVTAPEGPVRAKLLIHQDTIGGKKVISPLPVELYEPIVFVTRRQ